MERNEDSQRKQPNGTVENGGRFQAPFSTYVSNSIERYHARNWQQEHGLSEAIIRNVT